MSSYGIPTFNVGGLASGLDTSSIVSQLMSIERRPRVRLEQAQQVEEVRRTALQDVQSRLRNLSLQVASLRSPGTWSDVQAVTSSDDATVSARRVGGAAAGGYTIQVDALARAAQLRQGNAGGGTPLTAAADADTLHIAVGGGAAVDVAIASGDSIDTIAEKINTASGSPVYASVVSGVLVLSGKQTGAAATITVTGGAGGGYDLAADLALTQTQAPQNADFWIDGVHATDRSTNTVSDALTGVELTLKGTTGGSSVSVGVGAPGPDAPAVQAKLQSFVDQYNSTVEFIRGKLNEERVASPQTAGDRAKGVLRGDPGLSALLARLRAALSDTVSGRPAKLDQLAEIGIGTGASTGTGAVSQDAVSGKLSLDAAKLSETLSAGFADVKALFTNVTGSYDSEGIAQRLDRELDPWLSGDGTSAGILSTRIDSARTAISDLNDRMTDMDVRLQLREKSLRAKFTQLEAALQQMQAQSAWLTAQLGNL